LTCPADALSTLCGHWLGHRASRPDSRRAISLALGRGQVVLEDWCRIFSGFQVIHSAVPREMHAVLGVHLASYGESGGNDREITVQELTLSGGFCRGCRPESRKHQRVQDCAVYTMSCHGRVAVLALRCLEFFPPLKKTCTSCCVSPLRLRKSRCHLVGVGSVDFKMQREVWCGCALRGGCNGGV